MTSETKEYRLSEVAEHKDGKDVWMVIHDRVYDVTKFMDEHPGGEEVLRDMAGQVATEQFEDVGHSTDARDMMAQYEIGQLAEADRQHTKAGQLKWGSGGADNGQSGLMTWLPPLGAALLVAFLYRYYMA